jgi:arginyl-tRNA synthetase
MYAQYKKMFATLLAQHIQESETDDIYQLLETVPANIAGDIAFPCFGLSKTMRKSPQVIAQEITKTLQQDVEQHELFAGIEVISPYINIHINTETLAGQVITNVAEQGEKFGQGSDKAKSILVE